MSGNPAAELSAIASGLTELHSRIGVLARDLDQESTQRAAIDLFEVERALRTASRRLERARQALAG